MHLYLQFVNPQELERAEQLDFALKFGLVIGKELELDSFNTLAESVSISFWHDTEAKLYRPRYGHPVQLHAVALDGLGKSMFEKTLWIYTDFNGGRYLWNYAGQVEESLEVVMKYISQHLVNWLEK